MQKDGSFPSQKSKGQLKSVTCFADEFADAHNYNDLPDPSDPLDKQLPLADAAGADSSSDSSSSLPSTVNSDCEQEEDVDDETWQLQEEFLQEVDREEMDKAHDEYLRSKAKVLPAGAEMTLELVVTWYRPSPSSLPRMTRLQLLICANLINRNERLVGVPLCPFRALRLPLKLHVKTALYQRFFRQ